jgi:hypothetical protein
MRDVKVGGGRLGPLAAFVLLGCALGFGALSFAPFWEVRTLAGKAVRIDFWDYLGESEARDRRPPVGPWHNAKATGFCLLAGGVAGCVAWAFWGEARRRPR